MRLLIDTAFMAFELTLLSMDFYVLVQVGSLSEGLVASTLGTLEGPLFCMDPEVIEEIVPFTEV